MLIDKLALISLSQQPNNGYYKLNTFRVSIENIQYGHFYKTLKTKFQYFHLNQLILY